MPELLDLIEEVMAQPEGRRFAAEWPSMSVQAHACDVCGQVTPDVDLWAENSETGDQVWLCLSCGE